MYNEQWTMNNALATCHTMQFIVKVGSINSLRQK